MIREFLHRSWPWYVTGPLVGLVAVSLLLIGNKPFSISSNLRHLCAACLPRRPDFFKYDWRRVGLWNLVFMLGTVVGGFIGGVLLSNSHPAAISAAAVSSLARLGIPTPGTSRTRLRGVTGSSSADLVWVSAVAVGDAVVGPLTLVAHDAGLPQADGLLGRDFLGLFTVTIDTRAGFVTLAPE